MFPIVTQRHLLKFYGNILLALGFFLSMGVFVIYIAIVDGKKGELEPGGEWVLGAMGVGLCLLAVYTVYQYFKNTPTITVGYDGISFNKQTYSWNDIAEIKLTGKQPFRYIFKVPMEGATLVFNDGKERYIFDDMYSNAWLIKSFIQQVVIDKQSTLEMPEVGLGNANTESIYTFKGNFATSFRGIILWVTLGVIAILLLSHTDTMNPAGYIVFSIIAILALCVNAWLTHYFQLSDNSLIVKNHIRFWSVRAYHFAEIREVAFETRDKMPNCLRVITKGYKTKFYPAATLSDKTWLELKDKLEAYGVSVRNECI